MNQQQRAVVQQALDVLKKDVRFYKSEKLAAIDALRQLLEQPVQEHDHALEQALTRLQKRYSELEAKVGAQPEPVQEPDWLDKKAIEPDWSHVWLLIKAASYASSRGHLSGTTNWGAAMSAYLRHETPPAQPAAWVWLKDDELIAAYRRGRDSVPKPTNGWCFVDDHIPGLREVQREVLYTLREKNGGAA